LICISNVRVENTILLNGSYFPILSPHLGEGIEPQEAFLKGIGRCTADDVQVTEQVYAAGQLLSIDVIDHIIIGRQVWCSLREEGLGFPQASP